VSWVQGGRVWQGPLSITPTSTGPAGAALASSPQFGVPNQTDVFVVDSTGAIRVSWVDGAGSWNGPLGITLAGNAPKGGHLATCNQAGIPTQTDVFLVNNSGAAQVSWVESAGAWQGPLQI
jgi:hypothetical protein